MLKALHGARRPPAPSGLRAAGKRLWEDVTRKYTLRPDEQRALEIAARHLDNCARIDAELADAPLLVTGPRGRQVPNVLFEERRQESRVALHALGQIGLRDAAEGLAGDRSAAGRALVRQRWQRFHEAEAASG